MLRVSVEVFLRDGEARARLGALLARAGFARKDACRNYARTLALDLRASESELLASFSEKARRGIRSVAKVPVEVRLVDDVALASRLEELSRTTLARTGAWYEARWDWGGVIELSRRLPDAARLTGLFRTDRDGSEALIGFAWGWWNGQSVTYGVGASSRPPDLHGVQIGYPMMWDLIRWAKRIGATWFDLGGVSEGSAQLRGSPRRDIGLQASLQQGDGGGGGGLGARAAVAGGTRGEPGERLGRPSLPGRREQVSAPGSWVLICGALLSRRRPSSPRSRAGSWKRATAPRSDRS